MNKGLPRKYMSEVVQERAGCSTDFLSSRFDIQSRQFIPVQ